MSERKRIPKWIKRLIKARLKESENLMNNPGGYTNLIFPELHLILFRNDWWFVVGPETEKFIDKYIPTKIKEWKHEHDPFTRYYPLVIPR